MFGMNPHSVVGSNMEKAELKPETENVWVKPNTRKMAKRKSSIHLYAHNVFYLLLLLLSVGGQCETEAVFNSRASTSPPDVS